MNTEYGFMKRLLFSAILLLFGYFSLLAWGFFGVRLGWTNDHGIIDRESDAYAQSAADLSREGTVLGEKTEVMPAAVSAVPDVTTTVADAPKQDAAALEQLLFCRIALIGDRFPRNAAQILSAYGATGNVIIGEKMAFAVSLRLKDDAAFQSAFGACASSLADLSLDALRAKYPDTSGTSVFPWMNESEWVALHAAVVKDKDLITRAAHTAGIEPRLLASDLVVEQTRLFHSGRELFKKFFGPLKILGNATQFSLGVMGVKEKTAIETEEHLRDASSPYYLGAENATLLDFPSKGGDSDKERFDRISNDKDHYPNYLYAAVYLREMLSQWHRAGYPMEYRPEIACTLYNVGFAQSKPKATPKVGGSGIDVGDAKYSFGSLGYEFYYSGELLTEFPYEQ